MNKSYENKIINVMVENLTKDKKQIFGRTQHMTPVIFDGQKEDIGKILPVRITKTNRTTLFGDIVNKSNKPK